MSSKLFSLALLLLSYLVISRTRESRVLRLSHENIGEERVNEIEMRDHPFKSLQIRKTNWDFRPAVSVM